MVGIMTSSILFTACQKTDDVDTNQIDSGKIALNSFGPSPAMRGGELRFIGTNLDQVTQIDLPGAEGITEIKKVSKFEVRIEIPQTAEPGFITLKTPKGDIVTKTEISFKEPITIEKVTPAEAKAGETVTIEGDYLNNVEEIIFANDVHVLKEAFVSQARKKIEIKVPVNAQTGKIIVSDGLDLLSDGEETPNWIYSEKELVVTLPKVTKLAPSPVKSEENLTIEGSLLRLVESVVFENSEAVVVAQEDPTKEKSSLVVKVPVDAKTGDLTLVLLSGVEVNAGKVTLTVPTAEIDGLKASYGVAEEVVVAGENLNLVKQVNFANKEEAEFAITEEGKLVITVPQEAQGGNITLILGNGNIIELEGFVTTKPVFTFPASATPLDKLVVESTLSDRVITIMFGELEAVVTDNEGASFTVIVPLEAETGAVKMIMDNGEEVEVGDITISSFDFCAVKEFAAESTLAGDLIEMTVVNGENLTNVQLNDVDVKYLLVGKKLYVATGLNPGVQKLSLISGAVNVDYFVTIESLGLVEETLYDEPIDISGWTSYELNIDFSDVPDGADIRVRYTLTGDSPAFKIYDGHWGNVFDGTDDTPESLELLHSSDYIDLPVTKFPFSDWGYTIIMHGQDMIVSSISWVKDFSLLHPVWDESYVFFDFDGKGSWWGSFGEVENNASLSLDGSSYFRINADLPNGWADFFWRNGANDLKTDGVTVDGWVIKMDVNVLSGTTQNMKFRLKGTDGDFWYIMPGIENKGGWHTVVIPLDQFVDGDGEGSNHLPNVQNIDSDFGMATAGEAGFVDMCIDNIRFEPKR